MITVAKLAWMFLKGVDWRIWAALVVAGLLYAGGMEMKHRGKVEVQALWDADKASRKAAEEKAVAARLAENAAEKKENDLTNAFINRGAQNEKDTVHAALAAGGSLRISREVCSGFAPTASSQSPGASHEADSGSALLPAETDRNLKSFIEEIEAVAATGRACQAFVRQNGMYPATPSSADALKQ